LRRNPGSVLIAAIWALVFFTILGAGLYRIVSAQIMLTKTAEDRIISRNLARSACLYAKLERETDKKTAGKTYNALGELKKKREIELGSGRVVYTMIDEDSKININNASEAVIGRLPGLNAEIAKNIKTHKLKDEFKDLALGGAYNLKEELLLIDGVNEKVFSECRDFITVYTGGQVNINTAPPEVLAAIGFDSDMIDRVLQFRPGADGEIGTEDDGIFKNNTTIMDELTTLAGGTAPAINVGLLSVTSSNYSLKLETQVLGKQSANYNVVISNDKKTKQWTEDTKAEQNTV